MASKIEEAIQDIEEYIDSCKFQVFSSTNIIVNKDEIDERLRDLRQKTPEEIKHYQKIIINRDAILEDARMKAEALINDATVQTNELINEHEIMKQAYDQANRVVSMASEQAQQILDNATAEANNLRIAAMQYMDDMLGHIETVLTESSMNASNHYENLISSLNQYREVVVSNRAELHPSEPEPSPVQNEVPDNTGTISLRDTGKIDSITMI